MSQQPPDDQSQPRFIPNEPGPGQPYGGFQPPGGDPPYGYPGGQHFAPQPPPRKKRHWVRYTFLGIVGLIVLIVVISIATSGGNGVSTSPSGTAGTPQAQGSSPAAAQAAAPAGLGSYFDIQDSSGDTYRVTLVKIIDPAQGADQFTTPDNGKRLVGAVFTIKALSGSPKDEDANSDAALVGSDGQTYTPDIGDIAGYTNFSDGEINVAQGESSTGSVTFQVPTGVKVSKVQWSASSGFGSTVQWNVP
jgi:hypothetical protein